jgi:hypothetical protein
MRRSHPGRALAALALLTVLALPAIAVAQPQPVPPRKAVARRTTETGGLARLWSTWIHLWGQTGSGLDPNGGAPTGNPGSHGASPAGETGSGLDPDGK